ncbi:MAG: AraC family transcriptional regulator [Clostridia bacterium]|nr:AraC family transcriptional regulator [Clostridia bacterium]
MLKEIQQYVTYLIGECRLSVTLHPLSRENMILFSDLMQFNVHDNAYCTYIKSLPSAHNRCLAQQKRVLAHCQKHQSGFCGVCYAGVSEYVYPIRNGKQTVGFISVSGYASPTGQARLPWVVREFQADPDQITRSYRTLRQEMPPKEKIDTLLLPLCRMLELAYIKKKTEQDTSSDPFKQILAYIQTNASSGLTVQDICQTFCCSRSYLSHTFKKQTGKSFCEYLTDIRLERAKRLLELSELNVTEIAYSVGFQDSNYFSSVFKKHVGLSPLAYRKKS